MTTYSANANSNDKVVKLTFCFQYINSQKSSPITPLCILLCDDWWSQFWLLTFNLLRTMLMKNFVNHGIRVAHYIDESVQERRNSSALAWSYVFLALTHRYKDITFISVTDKYHDCWCLGDGNAQGITSHDNNDNYISIYKPTKQLCIRSQCHAWHCFINFVNMDLDGIYVWLNS